MSASVHIIVRIGIRFGPRDKIIPCPQEWALSHIAKLLESWEATAVTDPGPCFPAHQADVHFSVPAGRVRAFEIEAAPLGGWARCLRE